MLVKQICKDKPLWFQAASAPFWLLCSISFLNNLLLHQLSALRPRRHRSAGLDTLVPPHVNRIWNKNSISSPLPMSYRGEKPTWSIYRRKKNPILLKRLVGRLYSTAWKLIAIKPSRGEILPALDGVLVEKKTNLKTWTWQHFFTGKHSFKQVFAVQAERPVTACHGKRRAEGIAVQHSEHCTKLWRKNTRFVSNTPNQELNPRHPASPHHCAQNDPSIASTRRWQNLKTSQVFFDCPNIEKG